MTVADPELVAPLLAVASAYQELLDLYHEAYAAHHGERGPAGCPCCAEFAPRIAVAYAGLDDELGALRELSRAD